MTAHRHGHARRFGLVVTAIVAAAAGLTGCTGGSDGGEPEPPGTVHVLAGSELQDLGQPFFDEVRKATGVNLVLDTTGTLDGAQAVADGTTKAAFAWFSSDRYLSLLPGAADRVAVRTRIMLSPVVLGVKRSVATTLGWHDNPDVTWADVAVAASAGKLRYGMTNPSSSNSGFSALVGVASALSGSPDAVTEATIDPKALTGFFHGQTLTAGSSGFLRDDYVLQQDDVDGLINYESVLLTLDRSGQLHEPLDLIYPKDGIVTADYPLLLLDRGQRDAYDKVTRYLLRPEVQREIATTTARRPIKAADAPAGLFDTRTLVELPFPADLDTVNTLITAYLNEFRKPTRSIFVLDVSGSMASGRLDALKQALRRLTGGDTSTSGRFATFRQREQITFVPFSERVHDTRSFTVDPDRPQTTLQAIDDYVEGLRANGGTAIFDAVDEAYRIAERAIADDPGYLTSIVVMTDGENTDGESSGDLFGHLPTSGAVAAVHTYPILFGDADEGELGELASRTHGKLFDGRGDDLGAAFKEIRGYQ